MINFDLYRKFSKPECHEISTGYFKITKDRALKAAGGDTSHEKYKRFETVLADILILCQLDIASDEAYYSYPYNSRILEQLKQEGILDVVEIEKRQQN